MGAAPPLVVWRLAPDPRSKLLTSATWSTAGHGWGVRGGGVCVSFPRNRGSLWNHRYESRPLCGPANSMPPTPRSLLLSSSLGEQSPTWAPEGQFTGPDPMSPALVGELFTIEAPGSPALALVDPGISPSCVGLEQVV